LFSDSPWATRGVEVAPPPPKYRRRKPLGSAELIALAIIVLAIVGALREAVFFHPSNTIVTVCSTDRSATGHGGEYRVYTSGPTFVLKDTHAFTQWRTNSADVYGRLRERRTYRVTYVGVRISLLSWFPNITGYKALPLNRQQLRACGG
jgi:hypothetical protein